jgi:4-hydroxybenzoate polyprenyltransferase
MNRLKENSASPSTFTQIESSPYSIVVDIDGTIARRDIFLSILLTRVLRSPKLIMTCFRILFTKGIPGIKSYLANSQPFSWESFPKNEELICFLEKESSKGKKIFLSSGAAEKHVALVAKGLSFVSGYWGTTAVFNNTGNNKGELLAANLGTGKFDYIGDSRSDLEVAKFANYTALVAKDPVLNNVWRELRPQHWVKNLLVFAPIAAAHELGNGQKLIDLFLVFAAICAVASAGYVINDLSDLDNDSLHPEKKTRPVASGRLSIRVAVAMVPILLGFASVPLAILQDATASVLVLGYFALTFLYTQYMKSRAPLDVLFISILFVYRLLVGFVIAELVLSTWLLIFGFFLFLSLILAKRYVEVSGLEDHHVPGRGYTRDNQYLLIQSGVASGFSAVIVFGNYISSDEVQSMYQTPNYLLIGVPLLAYWVLHTWNSAVQGKMKNDPVTWALGDLGSIAALVSLALATIAAMSL